MINNWLEDHEADAHDELTGLLEVACDTLPPKYVDQLSLALERGEGLTRDLFRPIWKQWAKMKDMPPPDNTTPAGIAALILALRDLPHPSWSLQTRYQAAYAALRMYAHICGYRLVGELRVRFDVIFDFEQFLSGKTYPQMRDALTQLLRKS
ncbi:hypothetical protein [Nocardia sp. NPDC052566]|uniref:hypothetical protein n=1 Tax=Nocardia sp. NPDC052566 TaxID=3364330 RepID=UPI0037C5A489